MDHHQVLREENRWLLHENATYEPWCILKQKLTNEQLYQELPKVTCKIAERRMKLAGHCIRHPELSASSLVLWEPTEGTASPGRPAVTYVDNICRDLDVEDVAEIRTAMNDRAQWRELSGLVRAGARIK